MTDYPGKFITLEGGEGLGKTTNQDFIGRFLRAQGLPVVLTREPGGTVVAEKIRQLLLERDEEILTGQAELLLIFAARAQHVRHVIVPALAAGQWVVCDRFTDATYAYQGGGRGLSNTGIEWLENWVQGGLRPDLTLLFDAPAEIGMSRAKKRGRPDRFETEKLTFFNRVRQAYLQQAAVHSGRIRLIDARVDIRQVQSALRAVLQPFVERHHADLGVSGKTV